MIFKNLYVLVLWMQVASAFEGFNCEGTRYRPFQCNPLDMGIATTLGTISITNIKWGIVMYSLIPAIPILLINVKLTYCCLDIIFLLTNIMK